MVTKNQPKTQRKIEFHGTYRSLFQIFSLTLHLLVESTLARKLRHICGFRFFYVTLQAHSIE